jgi:hypothetical protein
MRLLLNEEVYYCSMITKLCFIITETILNLMCERTHKNNNFLEINLLR